jgi:hypothetical protein
MVFDMAPGAHRVSITIWFQVFSGNLFMVKGLNKKNMESTELEFRDIIPILIFILLAVIFFYVFIQLLPIIIILALAYIIYIFLKQP